MHSLVMHELVYNYLFSGLRNVNTFIYQVENRRVSLQLVAYSGSITPSFNAQPEPAQRGGQAVILVVIETSTELETEGSLRATRVIDDTVLFRISTASTM